MTITVNQMPIKNVFHGITERAEGVEGIVDFARRLFPGRRHPGHRQATKPEEGYPNPHGFSVVTFGIGKQGVLRYRGVAT